MSKLVNAFAHLQLVILNESFVDFAYEDEERNRQSLAAKAVAQENVVLIKSLSKDFGIAGLRADYAIMNPKRVATLVCNGYSAWREGSASSPWPLLPFWIGHARVRTGRSPMSWRASSSLVTLAAFANRRQMNFRLGGTGTARCWTERRQIA